MAESPKNEGLEDDFSFERVWFSGSRIPGLWFSEDVFILFFIEVVFGGGIVINPVSFDKAECWNGITFFQDRNDTSSIDGFSFQPSVLSLVFIL